MFSRRFKYRLLEEIYEQPDALLNTLKGCSEDLKFLRERKDIPKKIIFMGMGSSYFASIYAEYLFSNFLTFHVDSLLASQQLYYPRPIDRESLVVAISQSGESIETVNAAIKLKEKGVEIWCITNSPESTLAKISDVPMLIYAEEERCSTTKTFLSTITLIYMLWANMGVKEGYLPENFVEKAERSIINISNIIGNNLDSWNALTQSLALRVINSKSAIILGRGYNLCTALEGALLFKEVSKVHAEGMDGGQYRHGPIELTSPEILIISLATGATKNLMVKISRETKKLGGNVMLISDDEDNEIVKETDICLNKVEEPLSPLLFTVPLQLIAYNSAVLKGRNPDFGEYLTKITRIE
jgi:glucosamine--fructose-6-phosphate aminotransferase (isomerizing)